MSYMQHDQGYNQRRMVAFIAIVGVHVLIAWAFISGFGKSVVAQIVKDVQVSIIKEDQAKDTPPPPPKPELDRPPPVSVPPPIVNISVPIESPPMVVTDKPPPPAPRPVAVVPGTPPTTVRQPNCNEDYYPSQAKRLEQEGAVVVEYCVGVNNKIDGAVSIVTSSGFPLLDEAAGKCMATGAYKAGTIEGKPARLCKKVRVIYKLTQGH